MSMSIPTVTGWSNFWGTTANAYTMMYGRSSLERNISRWLAKPGARRLVSSMDALVGSAVGVQNTFKYSQVHAPAGLTEQDDFGGNRVIDTITVVDTPTTASDLDYVRTEVLGAILSMAPGLVAGSFHGQPVPARKGFYPYPPDLSGNGASNTMPSKRAW